MFHIASMIHGRIIALGCEGTNVYNSVQCLYLSITWNLNPKCAKNIPWIHFIVVNDNQDSLAEMMH